MTFVLRHLRIGGALLAGASALALAAPALAQDAAPAAPAAAPDTGAADIVVTAQYRSQNLQSVPVSITAVNNEQLRLSGANNLKDLQYSVPNVTFAGESFSGNPKVVIRGLYINTRTTGLEPSFGVYVDGVFQGRPIAYNLDLIDTDRVEYLRGPQGSLYGKNTISGAVNVITQQPGDHWQGNFTGEYGNYNYWKIAGTVRGPISDTLGLKVTGFKIRRDGFFKNVNPNSNDYGGENRFGGSAELVYKPTDRLEVRLNVDGMKEDRSIYLGEASNVAIGGPGPSNGGPVGVFGRGLSSLYANAIGSPVAAQPYLMDVDAPSFEKRRIYGASGIINYRLGGGFTLSSITAFRHASDEWGGDDDYSPFDFSRVLGAKGSFDQFTQELRLVSPDTERFSYVVGAFYLSSDIYQDRRERSGDGSQVLTTQQRNFLSTTAFPVAGQVNRFGQPVNTLLDYYNSLQDNERYEQYARGSISSYALYGQFNYKVTDQLTLIGGLRYSIESKQATYRQDFYLNNVATQATGSTTTPGGTYFGNGGRYIPLLQTPRYTDKALTPSATIQWEPSRSLNLFVRYARGFKGTGFNFGNGIGNGTGLTVPSVIRGTANSVSLLPEKVDSFEAGFKTSFLDRAITLNGTYYYEIGNNLQISALLPDFTRPAFNTNAKIQGFELEATVRPVKAIRLGANVGYTDVICVGGGAAANFTTNVFNASCTKGVRLENVSKWNLNANITINQPITDSVNFVAFANAFHRTSFLGGTYLVSGYTKVDGRVGVELSNGISAFVWGQNIFNKVSIGNSFGGGNITSLSTGTADFIETFDQPRTYGISIGYRF